MKNLLIKTFSLLAFLSIVTVSTFAFITDEESSEGNDFVAGALDLKIDSECHYWDCEYEQDLLKTIDNTIKCPVPPPCVLKDCGDFGNWDLTNLTNEKFFNFNNLTIKDHGEDTISYHVDNNEAYGCFSLTSKFGSDCTNCQPVTTLTKTKDKKYEPFVFEIAPEFEYEPEGLLKVPEGGATGHCAENAGYNPECVEKEDNWTDYEKVRTHTTTEGIINVIFIKAGTTCFEYTENTTSGCYSVSGLGTSTVVISENWPEFIEKGSCKDISHTEYVVCKDPIQYLKFFSWYDDGDNIFEPYYPQKEVKIFGPFPATEMIDGNIYTLADSIIGAIPPYTTKYIGLAWCIGDMYVNYYSGEITCEAPADTCICSNGGSGVACLDIEFYIEQARHNSDFRCEDLL